MAKFPNFRAWPSDARHIPEKVAKFPRFSCLPLGRWVYTRKSGRISENFAAFPSDARHIPERVSKFPRLALGRACACAYEQICHACTKNILHTYYTYSTHTLYMCYVYTIRVLYIHHTYSIHYANPDLHLVHSTNSLCILDLYSAD